MHRTTDRGRLTATTVLLIMVSLCATPASVHALDPWPAEPLASAVNLTSIEGSGANDFSYDLSGAVWNPITRTLWVCRNGPGSTTSKLWAIVEDGAGSFEIDYREGDRGEWTGFGDFEGVTQADFTEDVVYAIIEGEDHIKEYDVSTYGTASLLNDWDTSAHLPTSGGSGAEGITFVPDSFLTTAGFVDADGLARISSGGMGGLMFVGHQNGGGIYAFDLNRDAGTFTFVGEYMSGYSELASLEFDHSTGELYAWHDAGFDILSVFDLTSSAVPGEDYREMNAVRRFHGPSSQNNEGVAIVSADDCFDGKRSLFMTVDDGGSASLFWYREFEDGCAPWVSVGDDGASAGPEVHIIAAPNPGGDSMTISYRLPGPSDVCLRIFDVGGREIRVLRSLGRAAGEHAVVWDGLDRTGRRVNSGVYLVRIEAGGTTIGRTKLAVVR